MLKVIGASWVQTRISWTLLGSISLLGLVAVFFGSSYRTEADGKYAATVYYGKESKFRLEYWGQNNDPQDIRRGVARGYYQPDISKTGWASLEIETQESYPDTIQACAAGMLEGALSWQHIQHHWRNTVQKTCFGRQDFCHLMRIFLQENSEHIKKLAAKFDPIDPFWHQVNLFYIQLEGIETGWRSGIRRSRRDYDDIPSIDFLWMNIMPDLRDLERKFNGTLDFNPHRPSLAFAILKYFPEEPSNYLLAHSAAGTYNSMLRIQKRYDFGYHSIGDLDSDLVNGRVQMFTSYPGAIFSGDDYYQIENNSGEMLTVIGTELKNYNQSSWHYLDYEHQVLMAPRVMAANRLSRDGDDWSAIFTRRNSGTGNKQWLIIDTSENFTVWAVEQMPGLTHAQEVTQHIIDQKYWIACGIPYFQDISMQSIGNDEMSSLYHLKYKNPLYIVLHKYIDTIIDKESIINLVRSYEMSVISRTDLNGITNLYGFLNITHNMNKHHQKIDELSLENEGDGNIGTMKEENVLVSKNYKNITSGSEEINGEDMERNNISNSDSQTNDSKESKDNINNMINLPTNEEYIRTHEDIKENSDEIDKANNMLSYDKIVSDKTNEYYKNLEKNHKYSGIYSTLHKRKVKDDPDEDSMKTDNEIGKFKINENIKSSVEHMNTATMGEIQNNAKLNESITENEQKQNSTKLRNILIKPKNVYFNTKDMFIKNINKHNAKNDMISSSDNKNRLDKYRNDSISVGLNKENIRNVDESIGEKEETGGKILEANGKIDEPIGKMVKNSFVSDYVTTINSINDFSKIKTDVFNKLNSNKSHLENNKLNQDFNKIRKSEEVEKNLVKNNDQILIDTSIMNEMLNIRNFKNLDSKNNINLSRDANSYKNLNKQYRGIIDVKINQGNEYFTSIAGPPYYKKYKSPNTNITEYQFNRTNDDSRLQAQYLVSDMKQEKHEKGNVAPFQWSKSKINFIQHVGQPDLWDFQLFRSNWVWK